MPLETPRLDDRSFDDLLAEAKRRISDRSPAWTDQSESDPGIVMLELFAFLTDTMIYRLNRVPEKVYVELLKLMGVNLAPPAAARAELRFERVPGREGRIEVPRGTRVGAARSDSAEEPVVFATDHDAYIATAAGGVTVTAHHAELVAAEELGSGTGMAGFTLALRRPPVVAPTGDDGDLVVAVELGADEAKPEAGGLEHDGGRFRIWQEVETFVGRTGEFVYRADRQAGLIHFAPALRRRNEAGELDGTLQPLAAVPAAGRRILAWYRRGGGRAGNVAAGTLTVLKDPVPGVSVSNPAPAQGGREAETLENALKRGPQEIHSLQRAVTARDYELVALTSDRAVARAMAVTSAAYWRHAQPGEAEVVLVPAATTTQRVDAAALRLLERPAVAQRVLAELDRRRPLGSRCRVNWAKYKTVRVTARVVVHQHEDLGRLGQRVLERLHDTITPLPSGDRSGWEFGKTLRASHIYEIALREPGVVWVDRVRLHLEEVPGGNVPAVVAAPTQDGIWYAASNTGLFRTINDGVGWEPLAYGQLLAGEKVVRLCTHPTLPGLLAVVTRFEPDAGPAADAEEREPGADAEEGETRAADTETVADGTSLSDAAHRSVPAGTESPAPAGNGMRSRVLLSRTAGEDWVPHPHDLGFEVEDATWLASDATETLLLATDVGLFRLSSREGAGPELVPVDGERQDLPLYA
ncbi:MAG TPA: putative baseplate assembly protein, partial [Trueperaceae bacterium]|nr:putative baseplate assembly protein [Trueperaceae bacterium]